MVVVGAVDLVLVTVAAVAILIDDIIKKTMRNDATSPETTFRYLRLTKQLVRVNALRESRHGLAHILAAHYRRDFLPLKEPCSMFTSVAAVDANLGGIRK